MSEREKTTAEASSDRDDVAGAAGLAKKARGVDAPESSEHPEDEALAGDSTSTPTSTADGAEKAPLDEAERDDGDIRKQAEKPGAKALGTPSTTPSPRVETWREMLTSTYFSFDRRTLALSRVLLGWLLIGDLFRRTPDWIHMFGDKGILPTVTILQRPQASNFSILHGFSSPTELWVLWGVMFVTYFCVLIGYRTKVAQVLSLLFVASLNGRVLLIENGGYVVHNLLLLWTCFMPMGDRFSLDALLAELRRKRETTIDELNDRTDVLEPFRMRPWVSLVGLVLLVQIAAVYYFNIIHKYGPAWAFQNGTAVHFVMYVDRMVNPLIGQVRTHIPFFIFQQMGRSVILSEFTLGFFLLLPMLPRIDWLFTRSGKKSFFPDFSTQKWSRRMAVFLMCFLHIGFGSTFVLGPFAWALCVFASLLFSKADWDETNAILRRPSRSRTVLIDPSSGAAIFFGRLIRRFDRYDLLAFDEARGKELEHGIVVERIDGSQVTGALALAEIIAALPIGPVFAWMVRVPGISSVVDWALQRGRWSRFFGLDPKVAAPEENPDVIGVVGTLTLVVTGAVLLLLTFGFPVIAVASEVPWVVRVAFIVGTLWILRWMFKDQPLKKRLVEVRAGIREFIVFAMFLSAINQALTELWCTKKRWGDLIADINKIELLKSHGIVVSPQPEAMQLLAHKLRFLQGWFMFSPNPVMDDGTIVVDAITVDGRHVDPFWNKPPDFDLLHAKSYGYSQIWSDYFNRIQLPGNRAYRDNMVDYMRRLPERTGNPNDEIASGEVWWTHDMNPKWGTRESYAFGQNLLFSFGKDGGAKDPPPPPTPKKPDGST